MVSVEVNRWTTRTKINVDNVPIQDTITPALSINKESNFEVGRKEKHKVKVIVHIPILLGVIRRFKYDVFIDGKFYNSYMC